MCPAEFGPLLRALRAVREELRDVESHPLVSRLVDSLSEPPGEHLWDLARQLEREFATGEPEGTFVRLEQLLDDQP